jgi:hypothetical protein
MRTTSEGQSRHRLALSDFNLIAPFLFCAYLAQYRAALGFMVNTDNMKPVALRIAAIAEVDVIANGHSFRQRNIVVGRAGAVDQPIPAFRQYTGPARCDRLYAVISSERLESGRRSQNDYQTYAGASQYPKSARSSHHAP